MPKIVRFHETGGADVLQIEDLPLEEPSEGEVRLKVEAIGLNRAEVMFREGQYLEDPELPSRLGYEAAGLVDAVGPGVGDIQIGDRVSTIPAFSMRTYGVYGESAIVPAYAVASYPDNLSASEGAAIWMQYVTAYGALIDIGQLKADDTAVISAASSSVGLAAIQVAKAAGAVAIATTRGSAKKQFLLDAGADHVIVTNEEDLVESVMAITAGTGANLIFDPIGGPLIQALADAAAVGATIFEYGALSPDPTPFPLFSALNKGLAVRGYTLFEIVKDAERLARGKQYIYDGLKSGALKPILSTAPSPWTPLPTLTGIWSPTGNRARSWSRSRNPRTRRCKMTTSRETMKATVIKEFGDFDVLKFHILLLLLGVYADVLRLSTRLTTRKATGDSKSGQRMMEVD